MFPMSAGICHYHQLVLCGPANNHSVGICLILSWREYSYMYLWLHLLLTSGMGLSLYHMFLKHLTKLLPAYSLSSVTALQMIIVMKLEVY